uniref:cholecystokinin-like isoform X1 n=1 Tax=Doryrhamphus excisus TaxID=161450 RepID=UPI0025AEBF33|nr:cholecystokinin-like isoform X1 [Doryrhamphus excisus]XP_057902891.1 cholecystokinin-like isoform X1 [Doryrhamphus excisus]XP_057902892.1 cholecystokinin-like isoform X1 [Doryrhamphus excisus]
MTVGLSVCVVLVVLCTSSLGIPFSSQLQDEDQRTPSQEALLEADTSVKPHLRHSRSAPQLSLAQEDAESRANLSELLARLISSRKGWTASNPKAMMQQQTSVRRNSSAANSRGGGLSSANHRIADRDYLGWMDFGKRSAEEYEYSS